jgi:hypothetical protein
MLQNIGSHGSKHNKKLNKDKKQLAFVRASLILANNFLPLSAALGFRACNHQKDIR